MLSVKSLKIITMTVMLWGLGDRAFAHGLIQSPPSRNWFCGALTKPDEVANGVAQFPVCGGAFAFNQTAGYNFMSVLTHTTGRSGVGPRSNVCGFNSESFGGGATVWDQLIDWPTTNITSGAQTFTWNISWGPHFSDTQEFRYWITKPGFQFSVSRPLSFTDFEDEPFCTLTYNDTNPTGNPAITPDKANAQFQTRCTVPERSGRHVIYAEWGRNQFTFERFHSCVDVQFRAAGPVIDARIVRTPAAAEFVGSGTIRLDATSSLGTGLSYHWDVTGPDPSLYMLANPDQAVATLTLATPLAAANVTISLVVTSPTGTDSATTTLVHRPSAASPWFDMGVLVQAARTLTAGNRVSIRAVQSTGQDLFFPSSPLAITATNTSATEWPFQLAQAVNALNGNVRIGLLNAQGEVVPTRDAIANRIYTVATAGITGVFLQVVANAPSCRVNYQVVSQWGNGFQANVSVVNTSTTIPIFGYTLTWSLGTGETFASGWNATYAPAAGSGLAASNTAGHWNGVILQNGGTVSFGFLGSKGSGNVVAPSDFRLNGEPCTTTQTASLLPVGGASSLARSSMQLPHDAQASAAPPRAPYGLTAFVASGGTRPRALP